MPKQKLLMSVIFPMLNASEDVEGVFAAIAAQQKVDKSKIEVIVVDDGSTDDTIKQAKKYQKLFDGFAGFQIIQHKRRMGLAQTRYDGTLAARGEFVTFVDKKTRADKDYLHSLLVKKHNIVIGNIYMDKERSPWDRVIVLIKKKLYFPYFNHPFRDVLLDAEKYRRFKNKGGGGVMLVSRDYYLKVTENMDRGLNINDDSMVIESLAAIEPLLKTADAKALYLNRTGFHENLVHIYNRGPKFVDYYIQPGTRFFLPIVLFAVFLLANVALVFTDPVVLVYELVLILIGLFALCLYLAEGLKDFIVSSYMFPIAALAFASGVVKGLMMKLFRRY